MNTGELDNFKPFSQALSYELKAKIDYVAGTITHELTLAGQTLMNHILETREKHTREALIKLGWTPPNEN